MLEKLAKQTAVYGISTIVVRFLSYLLTPYYTRVFGQETYGVVTDIFPPCGVCRQALFEFGGPELNVIMAKSPDDFIERSMDELLPFGFGPSNVAGNKAVEG